MFFSGGLRLCNLLSPSDLRRSQSLQTFPSFFFLVFFAYHNRSTHVNVAVAVPINRYLLRPRLVAVFSNIDYLLRRGSCVPGIGEFFDGNTDNDIVLKERKERCRVELIRFSRVLAGSVVTASGN